MLHIFKIINWISNRFLLSFYFEKKRFRVYVIHMFDTTRFDINIVGDNNTPAGNYR